MLFRSPNPNQVQSGLSEYQLSWRQQNVPMTVGSIDATMKCGKALQDLNKRQTVRFSSPALALTPRPLPPATIITACRSGLEQRRWRATNRGDGVRRLTGQSCARGRVQ